MALLNTETLIGLLRGINVGGSHRLSMKDLSAIVEKCGCVDVRTYVQSGNVVFRSARSDITRLAAQISAAIGRAHGFEPRVLVLTRRELEGAAAANPFPEADGNPKSLHLYFLAGRPERPDQKGMEVLRNKSERFLLNGKVLYLHTPDGFGTSRLAGRVERLLGVEATARNWRTVKALVAMAGAP